MSETVRLYTYRELLRQRRVITRQELLDRLEISPATLKRDLAKLRDQMNTPIVFDKDLGGYRMENSPSDCELPGVWFSADELLALLTLQNMLVELMPSMLGPKLRPLQRRMDEMLTKQGLDPDFLAERIRVVHAGKRRLNLECFQAVAAATFQRKRLRVRHFNRERGEHVERVISPQQLVHYRDNWYVDAKCHLRRDVRCFAIDAIEEAQVLDAAAAEVDKDMLRKAMGASYGIFAGSPKALAHLRFTAERARWVRNEQWHPNQIQSLLKDGCLEIEFPYSDERELVGDILRYGADVSVLGPPELTKLLNREVSRMYWKTQSNSSPEPQKNGGLRPTILEVGAEGGSLRLQGELRDNAWRFRLESSEQVLADDESVLIGDKKELWLTSWEEALSAMDAYPWTELYPLRVHPDFRDQVAIALKQRIKSSDETVWMSWNQALSGLS